VGEMAVGLYTGEFSLNSRSKVRIDDAYLTRTGGIEKLAGLGSRPLQSPKTHPAGSAACCRKNEPASNCPVTCTKHEQLYQRALAACRLGIHRPC